MSAVDEPELGQLCIQVQPARAPGIDIDRFKGECEAIARRTEGFRGIGFDEGDDGGAYVNVVFAVEDPAQAWLGLRPLLLDSSEFGPQLKKSCMCMCTGEDGWNDYLLLYHFDPTEDLDVPGDS